APARAGRARGRAGAPGPAWPRGGPRHGPAAAPSPPSGYRQPSMRRVRDRLPALPFPALLVLAAGWWVFGYMARRPEGAGIPSFDIYASSYPNIVYALPSLPQGHGLLCNPPPNSLHPFPP